MTKKLATTHIIWRDAHDINAGEWSKITGPIDMVINSTGYIVKETKRFVVITHTVCADGSVRGGFAIPKSGIIKRVDKRKAR